jgi:hypothetical protein
VIALLALALSAAIDVPAGASVAEALTRARPGDVVVLGAGAHAASLGRLSGAALRGAGAGVTVVTAPEGEPGAVAAGALSLEGLTLRAGPRQCALVVDGGEVTARDVALAGGECGARVSRGQLSGERVDLAGGRHAVVVEGGSASLAGGSLRGEVAGLLVRGGSATLSHAAIAGAARDASVVVTGGEVALADVAIAARGAAGIVLSGGRLAGRGVTVRGGAARHGEGGAACVEALGGDLALAGSELARCGGPGVIAAGARLRLDGVDVNAGTFDCVALDAGARAELQGVRCETRGAGLVASGGATARLRLDSWLADPVFVVDCASGARVTLLHGETSREPCTAPTPGR